MVIFQGLFHMTFRNGIFSQRLLVKDVIVNFDNMNIHFKKFHKSSFRRCLSNYYVSVTFITDPKFQEMWHNVEQNTMGLKQFQHLLDSEKRQAKKEQVKKRKPDYPKSTRNPTKIDTCRD